MLLPGLASYGWVNCADAHPAWAFLVHAHVERRPRGIKMVCTQGEKHTQHCLDGAGLVFVHHAWTLKSTGRPRLPARLQYLTTDRYFENLGSIFK